MSPQISNADSSVCPYHNVDYVYVPRIGRPAPDFSAEALMPDGSFKQVSLSDYQGQWLVLFFYPLDWTFVCPTEIVAFSDTFAEFKAMNTAVLAASVDSTFSHLAWSSTDRKQGGLGKLDIPILSDVNRRISRNYGVMHLDTGHTLRGLFVIDPKGVLRHITFNDPPVGRNVKEIQRIISAFQFVEKHGDVCPANWSEGKPTMKADPQLSKKYFKDN